MIYFAALALVAGLGLPIAVLSAALGQAKAASSALEGMARQPEAAGKIQTAMILSLAFIESLVIFSFVVFIMVSQKLPETEAILKILGH
jgi:F-type H+-transporting ATPase subunit c